MSESFIQNLFAERIGGRNYGKSTAIYKFEKIKRAKRAAMAAHPGAEIIDMGVGEPDEMAFPKVVEKLSQEARLPENRGYVDNGDAVLKQSAARYMDRVCGVKGINPETEVLHSIGSKAALSILPAALINPGDYVLMTTPGYPVFGTHAKYYGGLVHNLPLTEANGFLPDLDSIPADVGADQQGVPVHAHIDTSGLVTAPGLENTFRRTINPPNREQITDLLTGNPFPDLVVEHRLCPGGAPRPCPQAISLQDPGLLVVNYRIEPVALRVYDPARPGPDGKPGSQADGLAGDLAFAFQSRTDRRIAALNSQPAAGASINGTVFPPPINAAGVLPGDPFTPMIRAYSGPQPAACIKAVPARPPV